MKQDSLSRWMALLILTLLTGSLVTGCSDKTADKDADAKMRKAFSQKWDPNSVPPEHRDKVRAFMSQGGNAPSAPGAPAPAAKAQ